MRVVGRGAVVAVILGLLLFGVNLGLLAEVEIVPLVDCGGAHDQDAARSVLDKDLFAPLHLKRQDAVVLEQVLVEHHARHLLDSGSPSLQPTREGLSAARRKIRRNGLHQAARHWLL